MLTQQEVTRMKSKFDECCLLDPNLKIEFQHGLLKEFMKKVEAKTRRTAKGSQIVLFVGEMR